VCIVPDNKTPILESPKAPAAILGLGDALWKFVAWLGNFDFIMSMREERLAMIFESLLKWGWLIILGYAVLRYFTRPATAERRIIHWEMVTYVGLLAFMSGVLLATRAAGGVPPVVVGWGGALDGCNGTLNTSRLVGYADKYKVAMVCSVQDPTLDQFEDERIAVSNSFTITGGAVPALIIYKGTKMEGVPHIGQLTNNDAFLFPKDEDVKSVKKLSDIRKYGGILLRQGQM